MRSVEPTAYIEQLYELFTKSDHPLYFNNPEGSVALMIEENILTRNIEFATFSDKEIRKIILEYRSNGSREPLFVVENGILAPIHNRVNLDIRTDITLFPAYIWAPEVYRGVQTEFLSLEGQLAQAKYEIERWYQTWEKMYQRLHTAEHVLLLKVCPTLSARNKRTDPHDRDAWKIIVCTLAYQTPP